MARAGGIAGPGAAAGGPIVIGLPARACRTFGFVVPTEDPKLFRQLAFAQLERRGLAAGPAEETAFTCHVHDKSAGSSVLSVDVVLPEGAALALPPRHARPGAGRAAAPAATGKTDRTRGAGPPGPVLRAMAANSSTAR